jgi:hypothetical protein
MSDPGPLPPRQQRPPFWPQLGAIVLVCVGGLLLLVPGGCAVFWIYLVVGAGEGAELGMAGYIILLCLVLAFGGFALIRSVLKR